MLSIKKTKEILNNPDVTDEQAKQIRDSLYELSDIVLNKLIYEQTDSKKQKSSQE